jgi:hypothetical protein
MSVSVFRWLLLALFALGLIGNLVAHAISWNQWQQLYGQLANDWLFLLILALLFGATFLPRKSRI